MKQSRELEAAVRAVADVLEHIEGREFTPALLRALRSWIPFDLGVLCAFRRSRRPWFLFYDKRWERTALARSYVGGGYLFDPYYRAFLKGTPAGLYTLADLLDDESHDPRGWSASHHVTYLEAVSGDAGLVLTLMRDDDGPPFLAGEVALCRALQPAVGSALRLHWNVWAQVLTSRDSDDGELHARVERALSGFGESTLTPRECEVVQNLLRGLSAKAVAARLGIAVPTVAIHRKRAYAKLGVSSQAELFHEFIRSLASLGLADARATLNGDPEGAGGSPLP